MWHHVAPWLSRQFTIVATELRGYDDSAGPSGGYDKSAPMSGTRAVGRERALDVSGNALPCGHYLPEEAPEQTEAEFARLLAS